MDEREARTVLRWARHYAKLGHIPPPGLAAIEGDCQRVLATAPAQPRRSVFSQLLHAVGGLVLGLATVVSADLVLDEMAAYDATAPAAYAVAGVAVAWGVVGALLWRRNRDMADAFFVAALAALVGASFLDEGAATVIAPIGLLACAAAPFVRRDLVMTPLASIAFFVAALHFGFEVLQQYAPAGSFRMEPAGWAIGGLVLTYVAALAVTRVATAARWTSLGLAAGAPMATIAMAILGGASLDLGSGAIELFAAIPAAILLAFALWQGEAPTVVSAAASLGIVAIVLAFDVGGLLVGVPVVLGVAVAVLLLATWLRRRWMARAAVDGAGTA